MVDVFTKEKRSEIMSRVKGKDTAPELLVRSLIHRLGFRFRLHRNDIPGKPDIVLPKFHKIIFVNGCFWHGHSRCRKARLPETNREFWRNKQAYNHKRDIRNIATLKADDWDVLVIWECELACNAVLIPKIAAFLNVGRKRVHKVLVSLNRR